MEFHFTYGKERKQGMEDEGNKKGKKRGEK